jgi:DNA polymerase-4
VKYADFHQITRRRSQPLPVASREALQGAALALIRGVLPTQKGIRLVGVTVSNFASVTADAADELPIFVEAAA